jgi:uroporphyrin-III C-methyltransferase / precorrin-2 dehydrogenase / sirohydrochlorin ferrochelatase
MNGARRRSETRPGRFGELARLPLFFALKGKRTVIAGGGPAAVWKAELVAAAGAGVDVYAADACVEMLEFAAGAAAGNVTVHRRAWMAADLNGAAIAVGDFSDRDGAAAFCRAARAAGVPCNVVDKPEFCDFSFGAIVNRSPLVIGISTDGAAPVFARAVRGRIEALVPKGFATWAAAAVRWRPAVKASGLSFADRRKFWELFTARAIADPGNDPAADDFDCFAIGALGGGNSSDHGAVTLISIDPGDAESLTLRAIRALHAADVILIDPQVPAEVLDFARREARKIRIGNTGGDDEIDAQMTELKSHGRRVVRIICRSRPDAELKPAPRLPRRATPSLIPNREIASVG